MSTKQSADRPHLIPRDSSGILLVSALLLTAALLVLGLGLMTSKSNELKTMRNSAFRAQAKAIAWAGLEQTRTKLEKDQFFLPRGGELEKFGFTEVVSGLSGEKVGSYSVVLDLSKVEPPFYRLGVTCTGRAANGNFVSSRYTLKAELDLYPGVPSGGNRYTNPRYFQLVNLQNPRE